MITCDLCQATVSDVESAIDADWAPDYYEFGEDHPNSEPICSRCVSSRCHESDDGELELIGDDPAQIVNAVCASYRVYNQEHPPAEGGTYYFDVKTEDQAISLTERLNKSTDLTWVWA